MDYRECLKKTAPSRAGFRGRRIAEVHESRAPRRGNKTLAAKLIPIKKPVPQQGQSGQSEPPGLRLSQFPDASQIPKPFDRQLLVRRSRSLG
jgi:hypothetical protein